MTVGHGAIVHGCRIGDNTLIGMGAIIMDDARVGSNCLIAAGAVVTQGMEIPDGSLAMGCPARVKRQLTEEEINTLKKDADDYVAVGRDMVENGVMLAGDAIPAEPPHYRHSARVGRAAPNAACTTPGLPRGRLGCPCGSLQSSAA